MHRTFTPSTTVAATIAIALATSVASAVPIVGLTSNIGGQGLVTFDSSDPSVITTAAPFISGLQSNESLVGIDYRPATGVLYALGNTSRLYTLDILTGAAIQVGAGPFANSLSGSSFGFDFNPVIDRIRVDSDTDQNLVLNPNDGTSTSATPLFYGPGDPNAGEDPNIVGAAYTNSFNSDGTIIGTAGSTQLYAIDSGLDILTTQANSAGTLGTVGNLELDVTTVLGFDIGGDNIAFAAIQQVNSSRTLLVLVDLPENGNAVIPNGRVTVFGEIGGGLLLTDLAVIPVPVPEPTSLAVIGVAGVGLLRRRR